MTTHIETTGGNFDTGTGEVHTGCLFPASELKVHVFDNTEGKPPCSHVTITSRFCDFFDPFNASAQVLNPGTYKSKDIARLFGPVFAKEVKKITVTVDE